MYTVNSFTLIIKFTLIIISGIEIPAVYRVNLLNLIDEIYSHHCKIIYPYFWD